MPVQRRVALSGLAAALALGLCPLGAWAQSAGADAPLATAQAQTGSPQIDAPARAQPAPSASSAAGYDDSAWAPDVTAEREADRKPHGFVTAGIGSGGYRELGGAVTLPLGQNGQLSIAVDNLNFNGRGRGYGGYGGYPGFGGGYGARSALAIQGAWSQDRPAQNAPPPSDDQDPDAVSPAAAH